MGDWESSPRCVTSLSYESDTDNSSYRRAPRMAEGNLAEYRGTDGAAGSRATRERQSQRREAAIPAAFGSNQGRASGSFVSKGLLPTMKGIADTGFIVA